MVGYCISQLVEELTDSSSDTGSTSLSIQAALDCFNESQDRESLIAFLKTVVPQCSFYFATRSLDGDLSDSATVSALFEKVKPTHVIHLAAKVGGLFANMEDKVGFFEQNLAMNGNIIRACH